MQYPVVQSATVENQFKGIMWLLLPILPIAGWQDEQCTIRCAGGGKYTRTQGGQQRHAGEQTSKGEGAGRAGREATLSQPTTLILFVAVLRSTIEHQQHKRRIKPPTTVARKGGYKNILIMRMRMTMTMIRMFFFLRICTAECDFVCCVV